MHMIFPGRRILVFLSILQFDAHPIDFYDSDSRRSPYKGNLWFSKYVTSSFWILLASEAPFDNTVSSLFFSLNVTADGPVRLHQLWQTPGFRARSVSGCGRKPLI